MLAGAIVWITAVRALVDRKLGHLEATHSRQTHVIHGGDIAIRSDRTIRRSFSDLRLFRQHYRIDVVVVVHDYMLWKFGAAGNVAGQEILTVRRVVAVRRTGGTVLRNG